MLTIDDEDISDANQDKKAATKPLIGYLAQK